MSVLAKGRGLIIFLIVLLVYIALNFATTTIKPRADNALGGPKQFRIYSSELHLIAFYPVYLVERWIRNWDFNDAAEDFNCDFKADPTHIWLWGDGDTSEIWYDGGYDGPHWPLIFCAIFAGFTIGVWRLAHFPYWAASTVGVVCTFLIVIAYFSREEVHYLEMNLAATPTHFARSVMWLTQTDPQGTNKEVRVYHSSLNPGRMGAPSELMIIKSNGFILEFRERRDTNELIYPIFFPYGLTTKTNWHQHQYQIEGFFPWHKPDSWTNHSYPPSPRIFSASTDSTNSVRPNRRRF